MRRHSRGVLPENELLPAKIRRAEQLDPARVIEVLERFVSDERRERLKEILSKRLDSVSVLFDAPHDPHNGAAVIRSAEAFGVQTIHVVERREQFLAAGTVSRSAEKWVDVMAHADSASALTALRAKGMMLVGAHPNGKLCPSDLGKIPKVAIVLGNERDGIAEDLSRACDDFVRVPMRGFIESLNVSVTAAILLHAATSDRPGDLSPKDRERLYARGLYFTVQRADEILAES